MLLASTSVLAQPGEPTAPAGTGAQSTVPAEKANPQTQPAAATSPSVPDSTTLEPIKIKKAVYPVAASSRGIQGQVWLTVVVTELGDVKDVKVISGDPILAEAAVDAVKKWKFKPYIKNGKAIQVSTKLPFDFFFTGKLMENGRSADGSAATTESRSTLKPGEESRSTSELCNTSDEAGRKPERVRVSQSVSQGLLIHKIAPVYPQDARHMRIQGKVVLQAVIGKDGRLKDLRPISGPEELIQATAGAVQQWRYRPYMLCGEPVEVQTLITVNFTLAGS